MNPAEGLSWEPAIATVVLQSGRSRPHPAQSLPQEKPRRQGATFGSGPPGASANSASDAPDPEEGFQGKDGVIHIASTPGQRLGHLAERVWVAFGTASTAVHDSLHVNLQRCQVGSCRFQRQFREL